MNKVIIGFVITILIFLSVISASALTIRESEKDNTLSAPTNFKATPISSSQIDLSWKYASGKYVFKIYRSSSLKGRFSLVDKTTSKSFSDKNLAPNTAYYYKVQAIKQNNKNKLSLFSKIVSAKTMKVSTGCALNGEKIVLCISKTNQTGQILASVLTSSSNDQYAFIDTDNSLVGLWTFDNIDDTIVKDLSSYGNDGQFSSAVNQTNGHFGKAISLDAYSSEKVDLGNLDSRPSLDLKDNLTISAWINYDMFDQIFILRSGDGFNKNVLYNFRIGTEYGIPMMIFSSANNQGLIEEYVQLPLAFSGWHHVAITIMSTDVNNEKIVRYFVDGEEIKSSTFSGTPSTTYADNAQIGPGGDIDEVLLFNRALSANEVKSLYDSKANPYTNTFTLPVGEHTLKAYSVDASGNLFVTPSKKVVVA